MGRSGNRQRPAVSNLGALPPLVRRDCRSADVPLTTHRGGMRQRVFKGAGQAQGSRSAKTTGASHRRPSHAAAAGLPS